MKAIEVLLAGVLSCALFMVLHAVSWQRFFGQRPQPPWSYVAGIIGLAVPFTLLMARWGDWWALAGVASVVVGGGASVIYGYHVRGIANREGPPEALLKADEYEAIIAALRSQNAELETKLIRAKREKCEAQRQNRLDT